MSADQCLSVTWGSHLKFDFPGWLWFDNSNGVVALCGCTDFTSKAWLGLEDPLVELLAATLSVSHRLLLFKINCIHLFLAVLGLCCCVGFSLHAASGGHSLSWCAGVCFSWLPLLRSTGSRSHGLQWLWRVGWVVAGLWLSSTGSIVVVHRLRCSEAGGILLGQGSNPGFRRWPNDWFFTTKPLEQPLLLIISRRTPILLHRDSYRVSCDGRASEESEPDKRYVAFTN